MSTITYPRFLKYLRDVNITAEANNDLFVYDLSSNTWKNTKNLIGTYSIAGSLSATSVTGSLKGDGSQLTNLTGSSWGPSNSFATDVRNQVSAGTGLTYNKTTGVFSIATAGGGEQIDGGASVETDFFAGPESLIVCTGSSTTSIINVRLPLISEIGNGKNYIIKNISPGTVRIIPESPDKIDAAVSASIMTTFTSISVVGTGSNWWIY